ncbi:MAG: hypothetical protein WCG12_20410 [Alcaligenaceae bacterium]
MEISQIQLNYVDVEDRMVLRINMGVEQHLTLVLTRRIVRFMLDSLSVLLQRISPAPTQGPKASAAAATPSANASARANEPPAALGQIGRDTTPFEERAPEGNLLNVGRAAVLVNNAACQQTDTGLTFTFLIEPLQPVNLNLSAHLGLGVSQLLTELSSRAQWFDVTAIGQRETSQEALMELMPNQGSVTYH